MGRVKKTGRNAPCPCGSGSKYKKCCLDDSLSREAPSIRVIEGKPGDVPQEVLDYFMAKREENEIMRKAGIRLHFPTPVEFQGKKVWALESRIFFRDNPNETFHQFILNHLRSVLTGDWFDEQNNLPEEERHQIVRWFAGVEKWLLENEKSGERIMDGRVWSAKADVQTKNIVILAFDIISLFHTRSLLDELVTRLKNKDQYQGARYEITVASIMARLGCDITYQSGDETHCEFFALHKETDTSIAVEAKSKHREGVLHMSGEMDSEKALDGHIGRLLNKALKQNPGDRPFIIFIDINAPTDVTTSSDQRHWADQVERIIKRKMKSLGDVSPFNAIYVTNFSLHYQEGAEPRKGEIMTFIAPNPQFPITDDSLLKDIHSALDCYGYVPSIGLTDELFEDKKRSG